MSLSSAALAAGRGENNGVTNVVIPYRPRRHFKRLHETKKRFKFVVAHRRAGKSVAAINEIIKKAMENTRIDPPPRYGYVGPSFAQTKDLIWGYLKYFAGVIPGVTFSEGDLQCKLPNGATITLYGGSAAYERMRGLYFDGIMLDEYTLLNPSVFSTVVRPCLADYRGWAIVSGTSNGDDHFHERKLKAEADNDNWEIMVIPVTDTDCLDAEEVIEMTKDMSPEEYAREMLCSFDSPVEGAYYGDLLNSAELSNRICGVPYDSATGVITAWDLGIDDMMAIWFLQRVGRELHVIDYMEFNGIGLQDDPHGKPGAWSMVNAKPYNYSGHIMPHDIMARELGSGRSRYELSLELCKGVPIFVAPMAKVEDGITATRSYMPMMYFDKTKTEKGRKSLKNYHRGKNGKPVHNWASHGADAMRTLAVAIHLVLGYVSANNVTSLGGRLRRKIKGMV